MSLVAAGVQAWCLLSAIPLPKRCYQLRFDSRSQALSLVFYPWVGAVLALLMAGVAWLIPQHWPLPLTAVCLLLVWVVATGALHLDGLADSMDALMAGHRDPQRVREVLKEPACGPTAVVALVCLLLMKFSLLWALLAEQHVVAGVFVAMVVSRLSLYVMVFSTDYVGSSLTGPKPFAPWGSAHVCSAALCCVALWLTGVSLSEIVTVLLGALALTYLWRRLWLRRIQGYVGDVLGAQIELLESSVLFWFFVTATNG